MDPSERGFEGLFRDEYASIVRAVAPIVGSVNEAEAIAQDAFAKAFDRWRRIARYDRPGAWVRRVAIRDAVRFAQRERRRPVDDQPTFRPDRSAQVDRQLELVDALRTLPARQRASIVLHHLADWPVADVANALGCAEATVRVHLSRGRTALALILTAEPEEHLDGL
jgi:RNA polymerase sigma-70 factor (ECF subfamily)